MLGGFAAAAAIILFVTAHEAGHFFAAKATGMKVTEFFFGFGPRIFSCLAEMVAQHGSLGMSVRGQRRTSASLSGCLLYP